MIRLNASAAYGEKGQYIARITGRDSKFTFAREFIGRKGGKRNEETSADVDDPGVYECCDIDRKRGKDSRFVLVIKQADGTLVSRRSDKEDAMAIAKQIDAGRDFSDIVADDGSGYEIVDKKEAEAKQQAQTVQTATEGCWVILQTLPEKEAKKVLKTLKDRVSPPKPKASETPGQTASTDAPMQEIPPNPDPATTA